MEQSPRGQVDEILSRVRPLMAERGDVAFAYVFGSVARGDARVDSDVDFAVYLDEDSPRADRGCVRSALLTKLLACLGRNDVDLVILNDAPVVLKHRVLRDGILVLSRDEAKRVDFTADTLRRYVDTAPLRRLVHDYTRRSVANGTFGREVRYKIVG
jgi:predicted nucleotidyltransferase